MIVIGIIPARGGSKSIPLKNIKPLNGKPLIQYSIESAKVSGVIDRLIVSTDHSGIAETASKFDGVEVIMRPAALSTDEAPTEWSLLHVCDILEKNEGYIPDVVLILESTSPLRSPDTIKRCVQIFEDTDADSVIGVVELEHYPGIIKNGKYEFLINDGSRRRQDRKQLYMESSTIYGSRINLLKEKKAILGENLYPLIIPKNEALDINELWDFNHVEALIRYNNE